MTRESAIARAERYFDAGEFIAGSRAPQSRYRTESQVPESRPQLGGYLEQEIAPAFQRMGFKSTILRNPAAAGGPLLRRRAHGGSDSCRPC